MKSSIKRLVAAVLVLTLTFALAMPAFAADQKTQLRFDKNGKFTIVQFADTQDCAFADPKMVSYIEQVLDSVKPDLVIFTGDNTSGKPNFGTLLTKEAIKRIITPVVERGINFTLTFGNHDSESMVSKERQLKIYQSYAGCLAYDADPKLFGCGTHNLPIYSSDGKSVKFNLWIMDSNEYDDVNGGYDNVHKDQIEWYKKTSAALEKQAEGKVPSLVFQHIAVPEIFELYKEVPAGTEGSQTKFGSNVIMELDPAKAKGTLEEWSCPPTVNSGEFDAWVERGDVIGAVFGHDHVNSFVGTVDGIDLIQSPGMSFFSYGSDTTRGCRVITLDEKDNWNYESSVMLFADNFSDGTYTGGIIADLINGMTDAMESFLKVVNYIIGLIQGKA